MKLCSDPQAALKDCCFATRWNAPSQAQAQEGHAPTSGLRHSPWTASREKFWQVDTISPKTTEYAHASQKVLKAAAARLFTYWLTPLVVDAAHANPSLRNKPLVFEHRLCCAVALRHRANALLSLTTIYTILAEEGLLAFHVPVQTFI